MQFDYRSFEILSQCQCETKWLVPWWIIDLKYTPKMITGFVAGQMYQQLTLCPSYTIFEIMIKPVIVHKTILPGAKTSEKAAFDRLCKLGEHLVFLTTLVIRLSLNIAIDPII